MTSEPSLDAVQIVSKRNASLEFEVMYLVSMVARIFPSSISRASAPECGYGEERDFFVYINLPTGQVSWHVPFEKASLFDGIERVSHSPWDGHDDDVKWYRISKWLVSTRGLSHELNKKDQG